MRASLTAKENGEHKPVHMFSYENVVFVDRTVRTENNKIPYYGAKNIKLADYARTTSILFSTFS